MAEYDTQIEIFKQDNAFHKKMKERSDADMADFISKFQSTVEKINQMKEQALQKQKKEFEEALTMLRTKH